MAGLSAGSLCWFEGGTTDSFGPALAPHPRRPGVHRREPLPALRRRARATAALPATGRRRAAAGRLRRRRRGGARLPGRRRCTRSSRRDRPPVPIAWSRVRTGPRRDRAGDALPRLSRRRQRPRGRVPGADRPDRVGALDAPPGAAGPSRRSRPSPAARAAARGRRAARGRTAARCASRMRDLEQLRGLGRVGRPRRASAPSGGRSMARRARPNTSRSRSSSRGTPAPTRPPPERALEVLERDEQRRVAPVAGSAPAGTSSATTAFRNSGWSVTPTGVVAYSRETPRSRSAGQRRERPDRVGQRRLGVADVRPEADVGADSPVGHGPSDGDR